MTGCVAGAAERHPPAGSGANPAGGARCQEPSEDAAWPRGTGPTWDLTPRVPPAGDAAPTLVPGLSAFWMARASFRSRDPRGRCVAAKHGANMGPCPPGAARRGRRPNLGPRAAQRCSAVFTRWFLCFWFVFVWHPTLFTLGSRKNASNRFHEWVLLAATWYSFIAKMETLVVSSG